MSILRFAADEATQLGHRHIGPEHFLLGILMAKGSEGARILTARGAELAALREILKDAYAWSDRIVPAEMCDHATVAIKSFLAGMGWSKWADLSPLFAADAQFIDSAGKQWKGREEIGNQFESLLLPYAKKTVTHNLESVDPGAAGTFIASVLWENVTSMGGATRATQRMTILVEEKGREWKIFFIQVTPVRIP